MRSIHKKTLKRFLSTLLALTMVLGMVPFTALAAPYAWDSTWTPIVNGNTWNVHTYIEETVEASTANGTQNVDLHIEVTLPAGLSSATRWIQVIDIVNNNNNWQFYATCTTDSSGTISCSDSGRYYNTIPTTGDSECTLTISGDKIIIVVKDLTLKGYTGCGSNPRFFIAATEGSSTKETTIEVTVPRAADLSLTVPSSAVTEGEDFTVTATSDIAEGYVQFEYNGSKQSVEVIPMLDGSGYAECTFTAVTSEVEVKATQFGMSGGVVNTEATKNIAVNPIPVYRTITYAGNAVDAYNVPAAGTVANGMNYTVTDAVPNRTGFTFVKWNTKADGSGDNYTSGATISGVGADITLYAVWTKNTVTVHYPASDPTGADVIPNGDVTVPEGSTVTFAVTPDEGYDPATLTVTAGGVALAPVAIGATGVYQYSFVANADTVIHVLDLSKLQYTVALPTGDNFNAVFTGSDDENKTSVVKKYGESYSFKVEPVGNYTISEVYINGVPQGAGGTYSVAPVTGPQTISIVMEAIQFCTVTYVVDGVQMTTRQVQKGSTIPSDVKAPTKEGYTFDGWYTASDFSSTKGNLGNAASDCEVYGRYVAQTGTIAYDANDGAFSGSTPATTKTYGQAVTLTTTVPTREGHTFLGWAYEDTATTPVYGPGATYSTEITPPNGTVTLYAVWQKNTYTVTLPSGTGFTVNALDSTTVKYGEDFTFEVIVDRAYAKTAPVVDMTPDTTGLGTLAEDPQDANQNQISNSTSATWTYTISGVKEDKQVAISVTMNPTHVVTFETWLTDVDPTAANTTLYMTQKVENGYPAAQPAAPVVEGYIFGGWVWDHDGDSNTPMTTYAFTDLVNNPVTIYAQMLPIVPVVTWTDVDTPEDGWDITVDAADVTLVGDSDPDDGTNKVKYGSDMTFTVTIGEGWDASKMAVGANGLALAPVSIKEQSNKTVVYTYKLVNITADTNITVVGVVRKTVKITYSANADDDVSKMPGVQTVNSYVESATDNSKIINIIPSRVGYTFQGWATTPTGAVKYAVADIQSSSATSEETADTTLYAIWKAVGVTASVKVTDATVAATTSTPAQEFEGEDVTLKATVGYTDGSTTKGVSTGKVLFYRVLSESPLKGALIGSVDANGTTEYTLEVKTSEFKTLNQVDKYYVKYSAESAEGFEDSAAPTAADVATVKVMSKALQWKDDNKITFKDKAGNDYTGDLIAGNTYTLTLPKVTVVFAEKVAGTPIDPKAGIDYEVTWYVKSDTNDWTVVTDSKSDTLIWTDYKAGQQFRAEVNAIGATFAKEVEYKNDEDATLAIDTETDGTYKFDTLLYTKATAPTVRQATTTTLAITGADNEAADVVINGATPFTTIGDHKAQFEGQTVTLTATVKETSTGTPAVASGSVEFYQNGTLIATVPVETAGANMGKASFEATMTPFSDTATAADDDNKDVFTAKYVANATYAESTSATSDVYIKSTAIQTPVIISAKAGTGNATSTTYDADLTGLLAGVEHTFTLKTTGATTAESANWSVVAKDGRTVASTDYDIVWNVKTGDNTETSTTVGGTFTTTDNKVGDEISVTLIAKNDMKVDATSKKAIIGTKQDVNVTVTASDEIKSTTGVTDAYQLDEVTLTATVAAAEGANATVKPTGTVAFYYQDGTSWVYLGEDVLDVDTDGQMRASIDTTKLPVTDGTNVKRDVKITAVYLGDATFNVSRNYNESTRAVTAGTSTNGVTDATVTVYSSVVFVDTAEENKKVSTNNGIIISANGALKANNADVTLTLSDIFTLDHSNATVNGVDLSKLKFNTDYTVQWWKLENASACQDKDGSGNTIFDSYADTAEWELIDGATNYQYKIDTVPQNVAYRAEITVTGTPITKGSDTEVVQAVAGRKVYYSNVLVVGDGMLTVTTNITTSANKNFNEEGIVKGETVTIHTLVAGATGSAPVCKLEATVKSVTDPSKSFTITADGGSYTSNGYCALTWDTAAAAVTPGYYTLTVKATSNNGYESQTVTRTLIVRDNDYTLSATKESKVYNGKAQGIDWKLTGVDIEKELAKESVVVYYYQNGKMVEPTQAGKYTYELYLPASAYWTELTHVTGTFTIEQRPVSIADAVIQTKVYNGRDNVNVLEVMLGDAVTNSTTGLPSGDTGVIHGDSIYATATAALTSGYTAGTQTVTVTGDQELHGDDAHNYKWATETRTYTEKINVQRSQVKGDIAGDTTEKVAYVYGTTQVPANDIILIDQAGKPITEYDVIYYYHSGDGVRKVDGLSYKGKYTVIARPADQANYKGGASETVYVADTEKDLSPTAPTSALIDISNTVDLYGEVTGIDASATNGATITKVEYAVNGTFTTVANLSTLNVGRYLVKVTASTGDTAYGIYTIVKARPELTLTANNATYTSGQIKGYGTLTGDNGAEVYYTWTGGTIKGVSYTAPTDAGNYVVTAHVAEKGNYTAHEVSANFTIAKAPLIIDADELVRMQYESYPDMVATFKGLVGSVEAPDTSLRDVQIQPEFIFNEKNGGYTNAALDQVGADYPITVRNALSRNYEITYVGGNMAVNAQDANADLAIHGMIDNANGGDIAYYGDVIQLYAYGNYGQAVEGTGTRHNTSSLLKWEVSNPSIATIDEDGLLTITGVGTFNVTLTRGTGTAAISTTLTITAKPKEVKVDVEDQDKVYNGNSQDYNGTVTVKGLINGDTDIATLVAGGSRGPVGSQVVTYEVNTTKYQSEIYGGLFTINHKEVTVKPGEVTDVEYGEDLSIAENAYTVDGEVGSPKVNALNSGSTVVASVRELYNNLDVYDGYEILVAGVENPNYNVTYLTKTDVLTAEQPKDVKVTAKGLTFKTGVIDSDGRTSGYMEDNDQFYKDEGYAITGTAFNANPNDRMYGEVNPVMDYLFDELIAGDSEADLKDILDWLVEYSDVVKHNINGDANVAFDKTNHLGGHRSTTFLTGMSPYYIDGMLTTGGVKNYTTTVTEATQNIYQRPVTLTVRPDVTLTAYKPTIINSDNSVNTTVLLQLLLNNLVVGEYSTGKGGLATLLGHTIEDLDIQIDTVSYSGGTITVTIKLGNTNYWTENVNFTVNVDPTKIWVDYGTLGKTSASVTMYMMDANGVKTGVTDVTGTVHYLIYAYDANDNGAGYSYYKNLSPVRDVEMAKRAGVTGVYDATYAALPAGRYVMFAIASNYTIIE